MAYFYGSKFNECEKIAYAKGYRVNKDGIVTSKSGRIVSCSLRSGYKHFRIRAQRNKGVNVPIHRFQAYMKFGDKIYESNICVRHLNSNPLDDRWENIAIGTHSDNMQDKPKDVRIKSASIASNRRKAAYSKELIVAVKEAHKNGLSYRNIMDKFGISSKGTISYIVNNKYVFYGIN